MTVTTLDGHVLTGTVRMTTPEKVHLYYASGVHVVFRDQVASVQPAP
ncbi:MAG: hypothetical protein H0W36_12910 [Gemmatimonadetes bacterium]|nr:hypothetical protein [Gemmatimonadota bacterium]